MFLSIITPTYNRAYILKKLYNSLLNQTDKDFEWIIINDGSEDNTEELVASFQKDNKVKIYYIYQENGGKQRAHNKGVFFANGELTICVDSDDALSSDAVETAKKIWEDSDKQKHIGILAKRGDFVKHNPICSNWPDKLTECRMIELQEKYKFYGDTALFFKTSLLKKHSFAEFKNEKFIPEDSLYAELDNFGKIILCKKVLYYCKYLSDGLTAKYQTLLYNNPMGSSYCYYKRMLCSKTFFHKFKNALISQVYLSVSKRKCEYTRDKYKILLFSVKFLVPIYIKYKLKRLIK